MSVKTVKIAVKKTFKTVKTFKKTVKTFNKILNLIGLRQKTFQNLIFLRNASEGVGKAAQRTGFAVLL